MSISFLKLFRKVCDFVLKICISFSLVFTPYYAYSAEQELLPPSENPLESLIEDLRKNYENSEVPPEFQEASQILLEMGEAVEEGRLSEYLSTREDLKNRFDVLSLQDQEIRIISPKSNVQEDSNTNTVKVPLYNGSGPLRYFRRSSISVPDLSAEPSAQSGLLSDQDISVDFNQFSHRVYPTVITGIEVGFEGGVLALRGVVVEGDDSREKQIGLVHLFKNIKQEDVIDYAYDREVLALLHKTKGLILVHTVLAKAVMGEAPLPSISFPINPSLMEKSDIKLEFIDRSVEPPSEPAKETHGVEWSNEGKPLYTAGDLLISYKNAAGEKIIGSVFDRLTQLNHAFFNQYVILDFLLEMALLKMNSSKDIQDFGLNHFYLNNDGVVLEVLSSFLNKEPLLYLHNLSNKIQPIKALLLFARTESNRESFFTRKDVFLQEEWIRDYNHLREHSPELLEKNSKGSPIASNEMAAALFANPNKPQENLNQEIQEELKFYQLIRRMKRSSAAQKFKNSEFWGSVKENKQDLIIAAIAAAAALAGSGLLMEDSFSYKESYADTTVNNLIFLGGALLAGLFAISANSIRALKLLDKGLPKGNLKTKVNQVIENWEDYRARDRLVGVGFRITSYLLYPIWRRTAQIAGQPHFFQALSSGLSPFQKVSPESAEGRQAGINQTRRLGVHWPHWRSSSDRYQEQKSLISAVSEGKKKIHFLSRLISYHVISGQDFKPQSLIAGIAPFSDELSVFYEEPFSENSSNKGSEKIGDFFYVSHHLTQYIETSEGLDKIDTTQPVQLWDKEVLKTYYDEGKKLYEKAQHLGLRKKLSNANRVAGKWFREEFLSWNTEYSRMLSKFRPSTITSQLFWAQLIMDHLTIVTIPLTSATSRGDYFAYNLPITGVDADSSYLFSSRPHFHEIFINSAVHVIFSAMVEVQNLGLRESLQKQVSEYGNLYENTEQYRKPISNEQDLGEYFKHLAKPIYGFGNAVGKGTDLEDPLDIGSILWKRQMISYRFYQVSLTLGLVSRLLFTNQPFEQAFIGHLYFMAAGLVYFGWPQVYYQVSNVALSKELAETKRSIEKIALVSHTMSTNAYSSAEKYQEDYIEAVEEFKKLYNSSKKLRKFFEKNSIEVDFSKEYFGWQPISNNQEHLNRILSLITEAKLPTVISERGQALSALLALGIFSNIAFVYLSVDSFKDLNLIDALYFLGGTFLGIGLARGIWSKTLPEHRENFSRLGARAKASIGNLKSKCGIAVKKLSRQTN